MSVIPIVTVMLAIPIFKLAELGTSKYSVWIGYDFALSLFLASFIVMGIHTEKFFWIECAILGQIMSILVGICIPKNK